MCSTAIENRAIHSSGGSSSSNLTGVLAATQVVSHIHYLCDGRGARRLVGRRPTASPTIRDDVLSLAGSVCWRFVVVVVAVTCRTHARIIATRSQSGNRRERKHKSFWYKKPATTTGRRNSFYFNCD